MTGETELFKHCLKRNIDALILVPTSVRLTPADFLRVKPVEGSDRHDQPVDA